MTNKMREILFRGQIRKNGEKIRNFRGDPMPGKWLYGGICQGDGDFSIIYGSEDQTGKPVEKWPVYSDTVGQYTGLYDRNNNRIFEGDILESRKSENPEDWRRWVVEFSDGSFIFRTKKGSRKPHRDSWDLLCEDNVIFYGLDIIGNIYDNPELLEGKA